MFKRVLRSLVVLVMVAGIVASVVSFSSPLFALRELPGEDGGSGGGTVTYIRNDYKCPDKVTEKTTCSTGGSQLCTPQYCN